MRADPRSICPPRYDREHPNPLTIQKLAALIRKAGLRHPLRVFRNEEGALEMLCGETRRLGAIKAGLPEVEVVLYDRSEPTATDILLEQWYESVLLGKDTPSHRVAIALGVLAENPDWTYDDLGDALGKSRASLTRLLRPFAVLPEHVRAAIDKGAICSSYAYYLSQIAHLSEDLERTVRLITTGRIRKRKALVKHVDGILNRKRSSNGTTIEFQSFKVTSNESGDSTVVFRLAEAVRKAEARMKANGQNSMDEFWRLVNQYFTAAGGKDAHAC
jgi:ParB/RepB/Spo0J family partition protein